MRALAEDVNALTASVQRELHERRRAEESYRLLFESNPHPMCVYETDTMRFVAVNDGARSTCSATHARSSWRMTLEEHSLAAHEVERLHAAVAELTSGIAAVLTHSGIWRGTGARTGREFDAEITIHDHVFEGRPARVVMALDVTERVASPSAPCAAARLVTATCSRTRAT